MCRVYVNLEVNPYQSIFVVLHEMSVALSGSSSYQHAAAVTFRYFDFLSVVSYVNNISKRRHLTMMLTCEEVL